MAGIVGCMILFPSSCNILLTQSPFKILGPKFQVQINFICLIFDYEFNFILNSFSTCNAFSPKFSQISARFLKKDKKTADLVGNEKLKASASVRHLVLPCSLSVRQKLIPHIIKSYSRFVISWLHGYFALFVFFRVD